MANTVTENGGVAFTAQPMIVEHVDITDLQVFTGGKLFDVDVEEAFEAGRISLRQAKRIMAARS